MLAATEELLEVVRGVQEFATAAEGPQAVAWLAQGRQMVVRELPAEACWAR